MTCYVCTFFVTKRRAINAANRHCDGRDDRNRFMGTAFKNLQDFWEWIGADGLSVVRLKNGSFAWVSCKERRVGPDNRSYHVVDGLGWKVWVWDWEGDPSGPFVEQLFIAQKGFSL